jgi:adenylate kinase
MILVAGVSTSGKTYTLAGLRKREPGRLILSASGILGELGRPLRPLTPDQAIANQVALMSELHCRGAGSIKGLLLDGHAMIETTEGSMPIPDWWYNDLALEGLVHIEADAGEIAARRSVRSLPWTEVEARAEQEAERNAIRHQAARLDIPSLEIPGGDLDGLAHWLRTVSRSNGTASDR